MEAFYGSREAYESIRSWNDVRPPHYEKDVEKARAKGELLHLDHGWDESKSIYDLTDAEIQAAAAFRGGKFLGAVEVSGSSETSAPGSSEPSASSPSAAPASRTKGRQYRWQCSKGHIFTASLEYVLLGGGWCPDCIFDSWAN